MKTILMIGTILPEKMNRFCYQRGLRTSAAETVQQYMLKGVEEQNDVTVADAIGSVRMKAWPKSKILSIRSEREKTQKGTILGVGYFNFPGIAFLWREKAIISNAKKWAKDHKNAENVIVLIYSMHSPFLKAAKAVKRIIPSAKIVLIVADLPLYMDMSNPIRRFLKRIDWLRIQKLSGSVDKYLLYTKYMAEYLKLADDKWMVFEGLINQEKVVTEPQEKYPEKVCLYAGNLDPRYGIDTLIEAFGKIRSDAELRIYGSSGTAEQIKTLVKSAKNVRFMGQVTPKECFEIMKKSTLLINPRPSTIGLAKYSCPSKTFEYLASGTPCVMNHLPGVPEDYDPYLFFFAEETADSYSETIDLLLEKGSEYLNSFGLKGAAFLRNQKNEISMMQRVLRFVES